MSFSVRLADPGDAQALLRIYAPYVRETAITFEYEVPSVDEFRRRMIHILERYPYLVAMEGEEPVGYACASAFKGRRAYDWSVETTIYMKKDCRGKGYGRRLYLCLEECLRKQNILNANACIAWTDEEDARLTNASARFHEKMGYRLAGKFHQCGYKDGKWYDMIWMEKLLGEHLAHPEEIRLPEEAAGLWKACLMNAEGML